METSSNGQENAATSATGGDDDPLTYNDAFPPLPDTFVSTAEKRGPALRSAKQVVTTMIHIPYEERKYKDNVEAASFGRQQDAQTRACQQIMNEARVKLELIASRAGGQLTVVLTGNLEAVNKAKRLVATELQTRATTNVTIPREYFGFILGRNRQRVNALQDQTNTEIFVPPANDAPDAVGTIRVTGTRDGVRAAAAELRKWSEERAKLAEEKLTIEKELHPFIAGPGSEFVRQLETTHNVRIHMPPPRRPATAAAAGTTTSQITRHGENEIVISGEREGVALVKAAIMKVVNEKRGKIQSIPVCINKQQHRYVIGRNGANLAEILRQTGVVVEVPSSDTNTDTITLRGEQSQLGRAVTMVYEKANSVVRVLVPAATWLHRYIIGREGAKLNELLTAAGTTRERIRVEFDTENEKNRVLLEGPPTDCEAMRAQLDAFLKKLQHTVTFRELRVEVRFIKHLIGKKGATINKIKAENACQIVIPAEQQQQDMAVIRIEGEPSAVAKAHAELEEIYKRIQNETQRDVEIDQKLHKKLIGTKGERIREIRAEFNDVQITFPEPGRRSDLVQLRGPRNEVDRCAKQLVKQAQELAERSHESTMHVARNFMGHVVGKGGSTLNKLREEHDVRIIVHEDSGHHANGSEEANGNENVLLTFVGRKKSVEAAKKAIEGIVKEVAKIREIRVDVTIAVLNSLQQNSRLVKQLRDECQPVSVRLPDVAAGTSTQKAATDLFITLRGVDKEVETAKQRAVKLLNEIRENSFIDYVIARPEFHPFIVGRNYANVKRYREQFRVRVVTPASNRTAAATTEQSTTPTEPEDRSRITLIGKQADVAVVKTELEQVVRQLENTVEAIIEIDPKWHKRFLQRSGELVRQISEQLGNVLISFPRLPSPKHVAAKQKSTKDKEADTTGSEPSKITEGESQSSLQPQSSTVRVKGPRDCVNEAIARLNEYVNDWQNEVTFNCVIPRQFHSAILAGRGTFVQQIAERFSVVIRFPERRGSPKPNTAANKPQQPDSGTAESVEQPQQPDAGTTESVEQPQQSDSATTESVEQPQQSDSATTESVEQPQQSDSGTTEYVEQPQQSESATTQSVAQPQQSDGSAAESPGENAETEQMEAKQNVADGEQKHTVADAAEENDAADRITVIGKQANIDLAVEELRKLIPVTEYLEVTAECLAQWRGLAPPELRKLMQEYGVRLTVLRNDQPASAAADESVTNDESAVKQMKRIEIYAVATRVEEVKRELSKRAEQFEEWRREQIARNARTLLHVAEKWHSNLVGRRGERIQSLQKRFNVRIVLPNRARAANGAVSPSNAPTQHDTNGTQVEPAHDVDTKANEHKQEVNGVNGDSEPHDYDHSESANGINVESSDNNAGINVESAEGETESPDVSARDKVEIAADPDEIVIVGYVERAAECAREIEKLVDEWQSVATDFVDIDARVHPRLIGARGTRLKEIMTRFDVRVTIGRDVKNPDRITVAGRQEKVDECINELLDIADSFLEDFDNERRSTRTLADHAGINFVFSPQAKQEQHNRNETNVGRRQPPNQHASPSPQKASSKKGITIVGGPWDKSHTTGSTGKPYESDFPAMAAQANGSTAPEANAQHNGASAWSTSKR